MQNNQDRIVEQKFYHDKSVLICTTHKKSLFFYIFPKEGKKLIIIIKRLNTSVLRISEQEGQRFSKYMQVPVVAQ